MNTVIQFWATTAQLIFHENANKENSKKEWHATNLKILEFLMIERNDKVNFYKTLSCASLARHY